jgi:bacteriocin-like protein
MTKNKLRLKQLTKEQLQKIKGGVDSDLTKPPQGIGTSPSVPILP